jgi:RND family efflux transporter MFP subunit
MTVAATTIADLKPAAAVVTTRDMGEARARIGGVLTRLTVKEGDQVKAGAVIGLVVDDRLSRETEAYDAQAAAAVAEAVRSQADLVRVRTLFDKGFYAKSGLDQAQAQADAAQANVKAARAQRAASAELSNQGLILAPASGRVLKADVRAGSVVTTGQTVAVITVGEPLLRLEVPEAQGRGLRAGQAIAVDAQDLPGVSQATIIQVYPSVTAGRVTADIGAAGLKADLVGQRVRVQVPLGQRQALILPRRFIATRFGIDYATLVDRAGKAMEVAVQTAAGPDAGSVEVLSGLAQGDVVVAGPRR